MFNRFKIHIQENFPELRGKKLLLAISGGVDSMVLYHLLANMHFDLSLAHCNFNLRGIDSDQDEDLIKLEAKKNTTPLHLIHFDTKTQAKKAKTSIQMAARELRYTWFDTLLNENAYDYLLTAHHADDNVETFIINLTRGTGLDGLIGIPAKSANIRRPFLPFSKDDIVTYANEHTIKWREDQSNQDNKYIRNKIRKELAPLLKEINPSFLNSFSSTLKNLQGSKEIVRDKINLVLETVIEDTEDSSMVAFKISELLKFSGNLAYFYEIFYPYGFSQMEDLKSLLSAQSGKQIHSKSHRLVKHRDVLLLSRLQNKDAALEINLINDGDKQIELNNVSIFFNDITQKDFKDLDFNINEANFDKNLLTYPLSVRKWEKGDYFYPIGMKGKKKLSKFFKDEKYSLFQKENIWLLCSGLNVIWLIGKRMDDRYKITDKTIHILKATVQT